MSELQALDRTELEGVEGGFLISALLMGFAVGWAVHELTCETCP